MSHSRITHALAVLGLVGLVGTFSTTTASAGRFGGGGGGHMSAPHFGGGGGFHPAVAHFGGGGFHPSVAHYGGGGGGRSRRSVARFDGGSQGSYGHVGHREGGRTHVAHGGGDRHTHGGHDRYAGNEGRHEKGDRWPRGPKIGLHCGHWNHWCGGGYTPVDGAPVEDAGYVAPVYSGSGAGPSYSAPPVTKAPTEAAAPKTCVSGGTFVTVVFQPNVTAANITAFLKDYDVTMADGPSADGMYRIRISQDTESPNQFGQMIESMRSKKDIVVSIES